MSTIDNACEVIKYGLHLAPSDEDEAARHLARALDAAGLLSDEHHSMQELYDYRLAYNALLFNEWARVINYDVHKSWRHSDGELCFGGGWFIVCATTPHGLVSNHYAAEHWDLFDCEEREIPVEYDGHTPDEALRRLLATASGPLNPSDD